MATPFLGEIRMTGFGFAPKGWALCTGQTMPINQNQALFSLLGTAFGGDGRTNFLLPDLRGRAPIHPGTLGNTPTYAFGQVGGQEQHTLVIGEMPAHNHNAIGSSGSSANPSPSNNFWPTGTQLYVNSPVNSPLAGNAIANAGSNQPHENRPPYTVVNFIIALSGIFPTRN
ncbi:MAG: tail fiber protein [Candidatus Sulfotelmatobacter sp.]